MLILVGPNYLSHLSCRFYIIVCHTAAHNLSGVYAVTENHIYILHFLSVTGLCYYYITACRLALNNCGINGADQLAVWLHYSCVVFSVEIKANFS